MENETKKEREGERQRSCMTPAQWPVSSFFPLSYFLSIFQEQIVTRATACVPNGELTNSQMDGEPIQIRKEERRTGTTEKGCGKGRCGGVIPMSSVVTIFEPSGSIRECVCNDFSQTEPDPCAQQSSRVISKKLPRNSATET